eukprot:317971-Rhodomonas_salina.2
MGNLLISRTSIDPKHLCGAYWRPSTCSHRDPSGDLPAAAVLQCREGALDSEPGPGAPGFRTRDPQRQNLLVDPSY